MKFVIFVSRKNDYMDITEAIRRRRSIRNYDGYEIDAREREALQAVIDGATSPFGGSVTIRLADYDIKGTYRPSTYGVITGARTFLLMATAGDALSALSAGYMMEQVVLRATDLGLGTCWVGGTFKSGTFDRGISWPDGQRLRIISPVGHPAGTKSLLSRLTTAIARSRSRKPYGELFFDRDFERPLQPDGSQLSGALELMRLAPSSLNSQPWRAVVADGRVDFYVRAKGDFYMTDMGIGLLHFAVGAPEGEFVQLPSAANDKYMYVTSYRLAVKPIE